MDTNGNTKELIKDLCSRLPYGVKVWYKYYPKNVTERFATSIRLVDGKIALSSKFNREGDWYPVEEANELLIKPYLFPLSSMNEKQIKEFYRIKGLNLSNEELIKFKSNHLSVVSCISSYNWSIDWLNKNHFDYRGLIPRGLAIDCTNLNIY